jgi:CheY-like chemotaxis protein
MYPDRIVGKRILLADDQQPVRAAIRVLLQMDQHRVTEATNGSEALTLYLKERYDLVITDYSMPEMAGAELAVSIKRLKPSQPIIMITAYAALYPASEENPVDAILPKPFSFAELRQTIAQLLSEPGGAEETCED